jgi:hypothetical protein
LRLRVSFGGRAKEAVNAIDVLPEFNALRLHGLYPINSPFNRISHCRTFEKQLWCFGT